MNDDADACFPSCNANTGCQGQVVHTSVCDVSRAAGGCTDGDEHHSSHQVMKPIHSTLRDGCFFCIMCTLTPSIFPI